MLNGAGRSVRRWALVGVVLILVVSAGAVAMLGAQRATTSQESVHRGDRLSLAQSLATLADGYFLELQGSQSQLMVPVKRDLAAAPIGKRPAALASAVVSLPGSAVAVETSSSTTTVGAGAEALAGQMPAITGSLRATLANGGLAISQVLWLNGHPSVAIATSDGPDTLLVAYRIDLLPIAAYVQSLRIAPGAVPYIVDRAGRLVTSPVTSQLGSSAQASIMAEAGRITEAKVVETGSSPPQVMAVVPVGIGGWHLVIVQPAPQFYGTLWHANTKFRWLLLGLLIVVAAALLWLHARRQAALHEIAEMAVKDPLTGLPNRVAFTRALAKAIDRHQFDGSSLALLFCDLDGFKSVNDQLGHDAGDHLLVAAAERIKSVIHHAGGLSAMVARLGGDEFTVLREGKQVRDRAKVLAESITDAIARPFVLGADEVVVGISVGLAVAQPGRDLLRDADVAMYRMKAVRRTAREAGAPDRFADSSSPQLKALSDPA
jgi:diguanylate cyclase (GGDEF)-like protein